MKTIKNTKKQLSGKPKLTNPKKSDSEINRGEEQLKESLRKIKGPASE